MSILSDYVSNVSVSANEGQRYICNVFPHWQRACSRNQKRHMKTPPVWDRLLSYGEQCMRTHIFILISGECLLISQYVMRDALKQYACKGCIVT